MSAPLAAPLRVLLAEDDPATAAVLNHRLQRDGCDVVRCEDGSAALAHVAAAPFDLVLAGANLPGLDGLSLLSRLRSGTETPSIPFVVLAWPGNDALVARAFALGASEVIVRPFSLVEAAARIHRLVTPRAV